MFFMENELNNLNVQFGGGLNGQIASKSPLTKNFSLSFIGDSYSDINSDDERE